MGSGTLSNPLHTDNLIRNMEIAFVCLQEREGESRMGYQSGEEGDNHQVHSKPICCLVNRLILLEWHVQSIGFASLESQPSGREKP